MQVDSSHFQAKLQEDGIIQYDGQTKRDGRSTHNLKIHRDRALFSSIVLIIIRQISASVFAQRIDGSAVKVVHKRNGIILRYGKPTSERR